MSDAELVEAVRNGDTAAFTELYAAHVGAVTTVVRANVHGREEIADVVQEVFCKALERLGSLREPDRFRPWLLSIARHGAVDQRRRLSRVDVGDDENFESVAARDLGPDERAELVELAGLVNGSVAGLSRRDATALALVLHLGYTPGQVAATLGVTEGAAKVIVHRARHRLRDAVALEVLVRGQNKSCPTFVALSDGDDPVEAVRHVRRCAVCLDAATKEVATYDTLVPDAPASGRPEADDSHAARPESLDER
ncbi:MAG: RNA polymerase sigma factor [Acidimicrobiales bacterium]